MIQRTLFNKFTLDRIEEVFAHYFPLGLGQQLSQWREELAEGLQGNRYFYISVNDRHEMDGIMLYDVHSGSAVVYARTQEVVHSILEKARKSGQVTGVLGDAQTVEWARATNLLSE